MALLTLAHHGVTLTVVHLEPLQGLRRQVAPQRLRLPVAVVQTQHHSTVPLVPRPAHLVDRHTVCGRLVGLTKQHKVRKKHRTLVVADAEPMVLFVPCPAHLMDRHAVCGRLVGLDTQLKERKNIEHW